MEVTAMWDEDEIRPAPNKKVLIAAGTGLILLLLAGCIFLFPFGFVSQPALSFSKREPSIVASKTYINTGEILALTGDAQGFWRVWQLDGVVTVSRFGSLGEAEWVGDYSVNKPLVDINGRQLILADSDTGQIFTIEQGKGVTHTTTVAGQVQAVAISETGQWLVAYRKADAAPESFDSELAFHSSDGSELFNVSFVNALPFAAKLNQNGTQCYIMVNKLTTAGLENHLLSYADTGQLAWTAQLPAGPPIGIAIKPFADRIAIAVDKSIVCYSGAGQPLWQHVAQGIVQDMGFLGQSDQLTYSSQKVSVFSFQKQSLVTTLSEQGTSVWQYEVKGSVPHVAGGFSTLCAFLTNNVGVHSIGSDGQVRWSQRYAKGEVNPNEIDANLAVSGSGTVLVQLTDGRMFVLRSE